MRAGGRGGVARVALPDTVERVVLARIDLLPPAREVPAASVLGRSSRQPLERWRGGRPSALLARAHDVVRSDAEALPLQTPSSGALYAPARPRQLLHGTAASRRGPRRASPVVSPPLVGRRARPRTHERARRPGSLRSRAGRGRTGPALLEAGERRGLAPTTPGSGTASDALRGASSATTCLAQSRTRVRLSRRARRVTAAPTGLSARSRLPDRRVSRSTR